ncbi:CinA family protein [Acidihalobacter ferrooxydans]|uniref:CinA family protein n=1 Tax=Acidihalobacter ferrooxydans TaxID=1765967 RepID=UPI001E424F39|nr:nicotinamide-nucleotide amidohydrolase family protein [Acidihalobacter ferrooxydans]
METDSELVRVLGDLLVERGIRITTAESCTGGWIAKLLTDLPGSSAWFSHGFVTYSNAAKQEMLGVPAEVFARFGAVSSECVRAMAEGALRFAANGLAIAVSGIAGPDGGTLDKPVGTVWFALSGAGGSTVTKRCQLPGDREAVRHAAARIALQMAIDRVREAAS